MIQIGQFKHKLFKTKFYHFNNHVRKKTLTIYKEWVKQITMNEGSGFLIEF